MTAFVKERTARKAHDCAMCGDKIRPGVRYEVHTVSPNDVDNGNSGETWLTVVTHARNADYECEPDRTEPTGADR